MVITQSTALVELSAQGIDINVQRYSLEALTKGVNTELYKGAPDVASAIAIAARNLANSPNYYTPYRTLLWVAGGATALGALIWALARRRR